MVFLTIPVALVMFLFALSFIAEWDGGEETFAPVLLLVGAVGSHTAIGWSRNRPLDTSTSERLADSYRTSMFTGVALAESVALISLAAVIITGSLWLYMIGLVSALSGLLRVTPGARDIARRQLEILSSGSSLLLLAALRTPH